MIGELEPIETAKVDVEQPTRDVAFRARGGGHHAAHRLHTAQQLVAVRRDRRAYAVLEPFAVMFVDPAEELGACAGPRTA